MGTTRKIVSAILSVVAVFALLLYSVAFLRKLETNLLQWCENTGESTGVAVGSAIGSYQGYILGRAEGKEEGEQAGKEAGLSASDTMTTLRETVTSGGNLEVLAAGVSLTNLNKIGEAYTGLYTAKGEAIFTVDLENAKIRANDDGSEIKILLPQPTLQVYLNQGSQQKLAETQNFSFTIKAQDGITAYLNTMSETMKNVEDTISNYDVLEQMSRDAAIQQVRQLAGVVAPQDSVITVDFLR